MTEASDQHDARQNAERTKAAHKAAIQSVAERNEAAHRVAKQKRQILDQQKAEIRHRADH
ncbi:MAG: hypothetical protein QOI98_2116 [Solirubrobacteraceae bacterium]|jgi:hypothetical protein|nr:hypothetical protein [Solirubrobacteraceae bacterium]